MENSSLKFNLHYLQILQDYFNRLVAIVEWNYIQKIREMGDWRKSWRRVVEILR